MTEFLQTLSLSGVGQMQVVGTPTDNINFIPQPIPTSEISFTWTPQAGPVSYFVGSTLYAPAGAYYTPIQTPITFTATVRAVLASLVAEGLGSLSRSQFYFTYHWDFGDGEEGFGQTVTHTYKMPNPSAQVVLRVIDSQGRSTYTRQQLYLQTFNFTRLSSAISVTSS